MENSMFSHRSMARNVCQLVAVVLAGVFTLGGDAFAQSSGMGEPQGRESVGDQMQGPDVNSPSNAASMPGSLADPAQRRANSGTGQSAGDEKAGSGAGPMQSALRERTIQPPVEQTYRSGFDGATSQQQTDLQGLQQAAPGSRDAFLVLVLTLNKDGGSSVLSATEMQGIAPDNSVALGDYFFDITDEGNRLGIESLATDPFEGHSFGGGPGDPNEHHFIELSEATVTVRVPKRSLDSPLQGLELNLFKLQPGPEVKTLDSATVERLQSNQRLQAVLSVSGDQIRDAARESGVRN